MSDFMLEFGSEQVSSFEPGINDGVSLSQFEFKTQDDGSEYIQLAFTKEGGGINDRIYAPSRLKARLKPDGTQESEAEARLRAWGDVNSKIKHIICNFIPKEEFEKKLQESKPKTFAQYVEFCGKQLPADFRELKGRLVVSYNQKGFLAIPYAMWVTGAFFALDPKVELSLSKRLTLERSPAESESNGEGGLGLSGIEEENIEDNNEDERVLSEAGDSDKASEWLGSKDE